MKRLRATFFLYVIFLYSVTSAPAGSPINPSEHWVGTWATANFAAPPLALKLSREGGVVGSVPITFRETVHTTLSGSRVRVEFSNAFGTDPLTMGPVRIALATSNGGASTGDIKLASAQALTFSGRSTITIPPGAEAISDAASFSLPAASDFSVSIFLPNQKLASMTSHSPSFQTNWLALGDVTALPLIADQSSIQKTASWSFLKSVDVQAPDDAGAIVAFGDSITDGSESTANQNRRWTDELARRLLSETVSNHLGVLNEGIGGNRVLADGSGPNAQARFERDVLALPGVRFVVLLEGINDISQAFGPKSRHETITAEQLEEGLSQLAERAHSHGIRVYGATMTPYAGSLYSSPEGESIREAVNLWIRKNLVFDGFIDFAKAVESANEKSTFNLLFDSGDHLHPNDAGHRAMADGIKLSMFTDTQ